MTAQSRRRPNTDPVGSRGCGAEAKVAEWARSFREVMMEVAVSRLEDPEAAEDCVPRALVRALAVVRSDPDALEKIRNRPAWLVQITRNMAAGVSRTEVRRSRSRRDNGDRIRENLFSKPVAPIEEDPRTERLREAAPRVLKERQLEVFDLHLEGMEDVEIARELDMKPETVRWHRAEGIRNLREHLFGGGGGVGGSD